MAKNNNGQGVPVAKTEDELLAELRSTRDRKGATTDEARALMALLMVQDMQEEGRALREEHRKAFAELQATAKEAISLITELFVAEYGGERQSANAKRDVLVKHGLIKDRDHR